VGASSGADTDNKHGEQLKDFCLTGNNVEL